MYPSKGGSAYGQQPYSGQQAYVQTPGTGDVGAQRAVASRQSMVGAAQDADIGGYRAHTAQGAQYSGPYASVYGSTTLSSAHQAGGKGTSSSGIHNQYPSSVQEPPRTISSNLGINNDEYVSASNRQYSQKADAYSSAKSSDYASVDGRHYADQSSYLGRELQNEPARRYDHVSISQRQVDIHERMDQATLLREQQILRAAQSLQSGSDVRQAEYIAARAVPISSYGGRMEAVDPRSLPILGGTPYDTQHAATASLLGGSLRRNIDDRYTQAVSSATTPYGVGLPPGRDYISGKSLLSDSDYLTHSSHTVSLLDDRKDDRVAYRRELERDEEHRRELIRAKEKDREKENREREERERRRERERERERRDRERDMERERDRNSRRSSDRREREREKIPLRTTKELPPRRVTPRRPSPRRALSPPRREAAHRHRSPVKEIKRDYTCKVFPFCLVDAERDYLSLSKRYPRLFISPECSKVVLHWPKQSLHLSLHTPVSFEHEYVELDGKSEEKVMVPSDEVSKLKHGNTVWNAKVLLMSGMDSDALNDMCSYRSSDDKIVHFNNIIRFAMIKKVSSFMAIGGPWSAAIDGGDPSIEDASLIQTARRYLKDITELDLQTCQHWNRFLEIHYDRIGEDGLFSHKEITVLYVPDLSESLPSLDIWRTQWLAHKKNVVERERQLATKDKKSREKKESDHEKVKAESSAGKIIKDAKTDSNVNIKTETKKIDDTKGTPKKSNKENTDTKGTPKSSNKENTVDEKGRGPPIGEEVKEENVDEKKGTDEANKPKTVKRKIIKRVVKGKAAVKQENKEIKKENDVNEEVTPEPAQKTFTRKKIVKKSPAVDCAEEKPEVKTENPEESNINKEPDEPDITQETLTKTKGKKKIIRRVIKKKVLIKKDAGEAAAKETKVDIVKETKVEEAKGIKVEAKESKMLDPEKSSVNGKNARDEKDIKKESKKNEQNSKKDDSGSKKGRTKDDREKKSKDSELKSHKEVKEKGKFEEPPQHPGIFLQTKRGKGSKIRSMSLSLDGLLDYNDKDIEESTFELSVFAEAFSEMLQYQMACRLLSFLEKLRKKFVIKKNQRKRERDEKPEKESKEGSSIKRRKVSEESEGRNTSQKSEKHDTADKSHDETMGVGEDDESKLEEKSDNDNEDVENEEENKSDDDNDNNADDDEDPEEIEEDQEMKDVHEDGVEKNEIAAKKDNVNADSEKSKSGIENAKEAVNDATKLEAKKSDREKKNDDKPSESVKSESAKEVIYDKELLQAFRYFDYNCVGYIKVEDLRCLLHNLGTFLSHRDVKELVQCALFESSTARDNRIFYKKLVKLTDI